MDFMYTETDNLAFIWHMDDQGAEVMRVYADIPQVCIPEKIAGHKVISIGAYCFSDVNRVDMALNNNTILNAIQSKKIREFCGSYVESIILPDSVEKIRNNAFYNCRKLEVIETGTQLREIGSDIFMNCSNFSRLNIRGSPAGRYAV